MSVSPSPPQGSGRRTTPKEIIIAEVINVSGYNANDSIFGASLIPDLPAGEIHEWTIYYSFVAGGGTSLLYSIDGGVNWIVVNSSMSSGQAYIDKVAIEAGDQVQFKFDKNGDINYCRVGQAA